jgi:ribosomal protein S18 acetylase RimI-like enzyme
VCAGERRRARAGERLHHDSLREVSGICTEPEYQGRGLARRLTEGVVRRQREKGQTPFLHVASTNARAIALYERLGFVTAREIAVRIMSKAA